MRTRAGGRIGGKLTVGWAIQQSKLPVLPPLQFAFRSWMHSPQRRPLFFCSPPTSIDRSRLHLLSSTYVCLHPPSIRMVKSCMCSGCYVHGVPWAFKAHPRAHKCLQCQLWFTMVGHIEGQSSVYMDNCVIILPNPNGIMTRSAPFGPIHPQSTTHSHPVCSFFDSYSTSVRPPLGPHPLPARKYIRLTGIVCLFVHL